LGAATVAGLAAATFIAAGLAMDAGLAGLHLVVSGKNLQNNSLSFGPTACAAGVETQSAAHTAARINTDFT
jgi:hypothetical protein